MSDPIFVRRREAATYLTTKWGLRCSPNTLAKMAVVGGGPAYRKAGRTPLYAPPDLDGWARGRIGNVQRNTADVGSRPSTYSAQSLDIEEDA